MNYNCKFITDKFVILSSSLLSSSLEDKEILNIEKIPDFENQFYQIYYVVYVFHPYDEDIFV